MDFEKRNELIDKNDLIKGLCNSMTEVFFALKGGELDKGIFFSDNFNDEFGIQVCKQDFKFYKVFFKKIRKEYIPFEFVFALNSIKERLSFLIESLNKYDAKKEYYKKNNFDYQIVISFIDRYLSFFKHYNSELLYQYCSDLQKGLFYINNRYVEQRLSIIEETLETIYFNEKYGGKEVGFDLGSSDYGIIYFIRQKDAKHFFEKEIDKNEYKKLKGNLQGNGNPTLIENKHPDIFKDNGFEIFLKWNELSKDEPIKKFSFIFQKLKSSEINKIRNSKFKILILWLKDNNFIDVEIHKNLFERGYFDSPKKILTYARNDLYNSITTD